METKCIHCGKSYETKRESSLYCSNSCRTSAYKYRKRCEQFDKKEEEIRQAQKVIDDRQKLLDDEKRKEKAEKRRKSKDENALKALQENDTGKAKDDKQEPVVSEPIPQPIIDLTTPEKPETTKTELPKPILITTRKKGPGLPIRDNNESLKYEVIGYGLLIAAGIAIINKLSNPKQPPQDGNSNQLGKGSNNNEVAEPNSTGNDGINPKSPKLPPLGSLPIPSMYKGLGNLPALSENGKIPNQNPLVNNETKENPPRPNEEQNSAQNSEKGIDPEDKAIE